MSKSVSDPLKGHSTDGALRSDQPNRIHHPRHMRIICIGAGLAGLCFAYKLQRSFEDYDLIIYEKNRGIAGVWFENRYPGVACDFPAHNYTYSFEPNPIFSGVYATGDEVYTYLNNFATKYSLNESIKTEHEVKKAEWKDLEGVWHVQVEDVSSGRIIHNVCDILIGATGVLNHPRWPNIPGLRDFKGPLLHSARWQKDVDTHDKSIGIIGNGSSGQQLVVSIQPTARKLIHFIRQPTWVVGAFGDVPRNYTKEEIDDFQHKPGHLLQKRKQFERVVNGYFGNYLKDSPAQGYIRTYLTEAIQKKLALSGLEEKLIPQYSVGCRRLTPGVGYLEALTSNNTETVLGDIKQVIADGVIDKEGTEHLVDMLICATGFDTTFKPRFPLLGAHGKSLEDEWADSTPAYLATAIPDFPNHFMFFGPNNPFAGGSYISAIECQADYMLKFCDRWQTENIHSFSPKKEAVADFLAHTEEVLAKTVWADECRSWYKKGTTEAAALTLWPGSGLHFIEALSDIRADDYNIVYNGNRFAWLGNGFSQTETDPSCDAAYYIRENDDGPFLSRRKRWQAMTKIENAEMSNQH